jgi:SpoVK/Ycf46/Vps4 family AAA+-type ATPase
MEKVSEDLDYTRLSNLTEGFSGSDLREVCRTAAVFKMKEVFETGGDELADITNDDMLRALRKMRESKVHCGTHVYTGVTLD